MLIWLFGTRRLAFWRVERGINIPAAESGDQVGGADVGEADADVVDDYG
ncbi:MAG: hypothetical protein WCP79_00360 [Bacillota bacterium]